MTRRRGDRFEFTESAERDLEEVVTYTIWNWGNDRALAYVDGLETTLAVLAANPLLGVARDTIAPDLLSFPYESHIVYYQKSVHGIVILRLLHQRMDPHRHL
jgi:toxin ParE1/3/4